MLFAARAVSPRLLQDDKICLMTENNPSLNLIFEQVKGRLAAQDSQINTLDSKANLGFGASTIVTALAGTKLEDVLPSGKLGPLWSVVIYLFVLIVALLYLSGIFCAYKAYRLRSYNIVPNPEKLRDNYLHRTEDETKKALLDTMVVAFANTEVLLKNKIQWTKRTLLFVLAQAVVLLFVLLLPLILKGVENVPI